ncbi:Hypothetical predicted protein [Pelobates cultripes]|uniref:Uncharacterized protein n=1 Tax=Pelobates cultripes TaxID=61616 RepID=A0AAD1VN02_PELCU|nr:Hypothetical predicted protein [Pelobates cultripes]
MAAVAYTLTFLSEKPEGESRIDKAFQIFWERLEALLSPGMGPNARKHTQLSKTTRRKAQSPQAPSRPAGQRLRETNRQKVTGDPKGDKKSKAATFGRRQVKMQKHSGRSLHVPDGGVPTLRGTHRRNTRTAPDPTGSKQGSATLPVTVHAAPRVAERLHSLWVTTGMDPRQGGIFVQPYHSFPTLGIG